MSTLNIPVVLGTARSGRQSEKVAQYILGELSKHESVTAELVDINDHLYGKTHPAWVGSEHTNAWKALAGAADGFVLVIPEYNHSYPGELKLLLDSALEEYKNKPVLLAGVSSGTFGGVRALEHITPVLVRIGMRPLGMRDYLAFGLVETLFNDDGSIKDPKTTSIVHDRIETLKKYCDVMKLLRNPKETP